MSEKMKNTISLMIIMSVVNIVLTVFMLLLSFIDSNVTVLYVALIVVLAASMIPVIVMKRGPSMIVPDLAFGLTCFVISLIDKGKYTGFGYEYRHLSEYSAFEAFAQIMKCVAGLYLIQLFIYMICMYIRVFICFFKRPNKAPVTTRDENTTQGGNEE